MGGLRAFAFETGATLRLDYKQSVELAIKTPVDKATLIPGLIVQGHTLALGESVLLTAQTAGAENGIWQIGATAPVRRSDADSGIKLSAGVTVPVTAGTYANTEQVLTTSGEITIDVTALTFTERSTNAAAITGLGTAATKDVGTAAGTVAAGDTVASHTSSTTGAHGGIVASNDARLSDARPPTLHSTTHFAGAGDVLTPGNIGAATASDLSNHTGMTTGAHGGIVASNDARLSDARTPTAHNHGSYTGQVEWCQGLFYNSNDGNALYKRAWRISVENGIVTNIESLGAYKINVETP
jgi:hypothetical protein